jgi:hypothetical protein
MEPQPTIAESADAWQPLFEVANGRRLLSRGLLIAFRGWWRQRADQVNAAFGYVPDGEVIGRDCQPSESEHVAAGIGPLACRLLPSCSPTRISGSFDRLLGSGMEIVRL